MRHVWRSMLVAMLLSLPAMSAIAQDCFSLSPTANQGNDPYRPLKVRELTRTEHEHLIRLFKSLNGFWQGTGEEVLCRGSAESPAQQTTQYTLRSKISTDYYGNFSMTVELFAPQKSTSHQEMLDIYLTEKTMRADSSGSAGEVELIAITPESVTYRQRMVTPSGLKGGALQRESFTTIRMSARALFIDRRFYIQSRFNGRKQWRLDKT